MFLSLAPNVSISIWLAHWTRAIFKLGTDSRGLSAQILKILSVSIRANLHPNEVRQTPVTQWDSEISQKVGAAKYYTAKRHFATNWEFNG
jgi:hypothetical protein